MLIKRKENKIIDRKSQFMIVGSLFILLGISLIGIRLFTNFKAESQEEKSISDFYIEQGQIQKNEASEEINEEVPKEEKKTKNTHSINYVAVIKIPKISLEKGLVNKDSYYNNVNRNIQILDESDMPDKENGNVILAGHSGNGRTAYFKKLDKLSREDSVSIFYNGYEYKYKVVNSYDVEKTGTAHIVRNAQKSTLTLITCRHNTNKQIVIICELVEIL